MASLFLSRLNAEQRNELVARLHEMQRGVCFICERPIDLAIHAGSLDIDHVEPLSAGGKDDEANLAITHESCNRSKRASDLRVARVLARFASIQEEVRASDGRGANLSDILSRYGGAQYALKFRIEGEEFIYGQSEAGDAAVRKVPLWTDPLALGRSPRSGPIPSLWADPLALGRSPEWLALLLCGLADRLSAPRRPHQPAQHRP